MTDNATPKRRYALEEIAQFVEWINADIARHPERNAHMTPEEHAMWAGFPAQIRAHRYPFAYLDPHRPILDYLKSGLIGPTAPTQVTNQ